MGMVLALRSVGSGSFWPTEGLWRSCICIWFSGFFSSPAAMAQASGWDKVGHCGALSAAAGHPAKAAVVREVIAVFEGERSFMCRGGGRFGCGNGGAAVSGKEGEWCTWSALPVFNPMRRALAEL